ncbi:bifunctional 5,10-methylenetetrahydrofolate dehydrogenase/5,10-methenyltetrahydrofolate cyclohydrolase [Candidatus Gottesmanbacteria bacterium]|nr:bifunctional 5,10-methylenetetrahydrofolate dehydrogenase/5,10-methenyltetrahydrofolate cyclohydrolase [Candidatus Gottesmanbacteria bacterium]
MKIDGRHIASEIKENLKSKILNLKSQNITPHLAIILVGSDPGSKAYVNQKIKIGKELGVKVSLHSPSKLDQLVKLVKSLNSNPKIHGIIIQRPTPLPIEKADLDKLVNPKKDVDGFHPSSPFTPPIALAVLKILNWIYKKPKDTSDNSNKATKTPPTKDTSDGVRMHSSEVEGSNPNFHKWLSKKSLLIIGRGETGGKPIAETFKKMNIPYKVAHSKTEDIKELIKKSDIIISCVGKPNVIRKELFLPTTNYKLQTILIGVGMHEEQGKLKGDYDEDEVKDVVSFYTPIPGGVGPVNVACLFGNLIKAVKLQMDK